MRSYGRASVQDFLGDFIVYRNLIPIDQRLPGLTELREKLDLSTGMTPRKSSPEYAQVVAQIMNRAQAIRGEKAVIERLIYIGDTRVNDGIAFANLLAAGRWNGALFIGSETTEPEETRVESHGGATILLSNRWSTLDSFASVCRKRGIPIDERTAVVIDLDKTALGARGRNDHVIDEVRLQAMRRTIKGLLGDCLDEAAFEADYNRLNLPLYHPFTTDNQDYLAYICLILQSGAIAQEVLFDALDRGQIRQFVQLLAWVDEREGTLSPSLRQVHKGVKAALSEGNPTPFVDFRHNEYRITMDRMGSLADEAPVEKILQEEIVITHEVMQIALRFRDEGVLLFGLSDKPDEASLPPDGFSDYLPIHEKTTHVVGGD
ncbi:MAG: hypothetical protein U9Q94_00450 [Candidatus Bipolaricaulota bacterium]|nr:hypothetical protein [Candidatus Bipolaricaulota bacterium]